jgi:hypothetical protein
MISKIKNKGEHMSLQDEIMSLLNNGTRQQYRIYINGELLETAKPKTVEEAGEIVEAIASVGQEVKVAIKDMDDVVILENVYNGQSSQKEHTIVKITITAEGEEPQEALGLFTETIKDAIENDYKNFELKGFQEGSTNTIYVQLF